ncbi:conjugal transfer protein [Wolbachia endosymbiont of Dipetalonema caudispina]|uniref:type IV secretion system protein n=1 Tax=Wolbachia endosymbiont of Dipetalonema caudispina TaxID=1812112 RepID=UPI00158B0213|nr:type IV secretion system protein [Wolbachia endosymbiont of Dipetalonema caudispina]QKX01261.1 conjugal transfer protein [Wolbachia endosymbiont of Dipetalonema caudispina]
MQSRLDKFCFRLIFLAAYAVITGCNKNDMPFPRCISADYFGPEPITVNAHFPDNHDAFIPENGEIIDYDTGELNNGFHPNQVVKWKDTGLETNGDDLIVRINGAWISWNINNKKKNKDSQDLQKLEHIKYATKFQNEQANNGLPDFYSICSDYKSSIKNFSSNLNTNCTMNRKQHINENNDNNIIVSYNTSAPCWFTNGHGAYFLFRRSNINAIGKKEFIDPNPNNNLELIRNPHSPTIHLGYNSTAENGSGLFILKKGDKTKLKDRNCNMLELEKGWKIYVKILDRYYQNNIGGYSFEFLSGVQKPNVAGSFDYIYNYLKCILLINKNCEKQFNNNDPAVAQTIFQNIAEKSKSFHNFVLSLLVLFIIISSLLYLFGMIQETKHDIFIRMIKITLVTTLISPGSFKFFYDHFLILFIKGLEDLISIITNFAPNINTESLAQENKTYTKLFKFMEEMFNKFFSYSVWKKFAAFFHYQIWTSILMIPAIFIGITLYFLLCVYAYIIFLFGFIGIAFLIAIMPLFLISILFSSLKGIFEGWIKFCISFCLQSIMIFTLLSLLASIIMNTFYRQLGFTVCYNKWLEVKLCTPKWWWALSNFCIIDKQYFGWTPGQIFIPYSLGEATQLKIDKDIEGIENLSRIGGTIQFTGGAGYIPLPPNYIKKGFRYIDYPFFNPVPGIKDSPADHYIGENDIIVDKNCSVKDLVRLTNSLSYALEKSDILFLIKNIEKKIGNISNKILKNYCQSQQHEKKCKNYKIIIENYKKGIISPAFKSEIKSLLQNIIENQGCKILKFHELYKDPNSKFCQKCKICDNCKNYQENSDYQRIQDIQRGYLINIGEIFVLFFLTFLMFSLRKFVQQMGSSIASGGFSIYNISSIYSTSPLIAPIEELKQLWQNFTGRKLESLGSWIINLPDRLAGGTANFLNRTPKVGSTLKHTIDISRKLVSATIETTKFATSSNNDVNKLEEKIYKAFGVDKEDITHRKISRYLKYYKGYIGSHLGYTIEDAMKFTWKHNVDSIGKYSYNHNLLYRTKSHRREFLEKLYDYTIGHKKKPEQYKNKNNNEN